MHTEDYEAIVVSGSRVVGDRRTPALICLSPCGNVTLSAGHSRPLPVITTIEYQAANCNRSELLESKRAANDALFGANWFVVEMPVAILAGHFRYGTTFTSRLAGAD
jgi:hypothetical protein